MPTQYNGRCLALLFDLDGVLVNSAECVERTWREWATERELDPAHVIENAHGRRTIDTIRFVAPHLVASEEAEALEAREMTTAGVYEVDGARELLEQLKPDSWAIVTSGTRALATSRLRFARLPVPSVLICADEIALGKPDPEGYLTAAARLGFAPEDCIVIEDSPAGLDAAHAAGMRAVAVVGTYAESELRSADLIVPHLSALRVRPNANELEVWATRTN